MPPAYSKDSASLRVLENFSLQRALADAAPASRTMGEMLFRSGRVQSFSWSAGGDELKAEVGRNPYQIVTVRVSKTGGVRASCDCATFQVGRRLCQHGVAVLFAVHGITRKSLPQNLFVGPETWEKLRTELYSRPQSKRAKKPEPPVVVVNLDVEPEEGTFEYHEAGKGYQEGWQDVPPRLRSFIGWQAVYSGRAAEAFVKWFAVDRDHEVRVQLNDQIFPLPQHQLVEVRTEYNVALEGDEVVIRRVLLPTAGGEPVEVRRLVDKGLFFLADGRFAWLVEDKQSHFWSYVSAAVGREPWNGEDLDDEPDGDDDDWEDEKAEVVGGWSENRMSVRVSIDDWNAIQLQVPAAFLRNPPIGLTRDGREVVPAMATVAATLDVSASEEGAFSAGLRLRVGAVDLASAGSLWNRVAFTLCRFPPAFIRLRARSQVLRRGIFRFLAAESVKERQEVVREVVADASVKRLSDGPALAKQIFRILGEPLSVKEGATLVADPTGEAGWCLAPKLIQTSARVACLLLEAIPEADLVASGNPSGEFRIGEGEFSRGLAPLMAVCDQAGVAVTFQARAVESIDLDFAVSAKAEGDNLDWFALSPEVLADGSRIPQEKWEAWVRGGIVQDEDGRVRVLNPKSAQTLRAFAKVLNLHQEEGGQKKKRGPTVLRVPRLRIFDWIALRQAGVRCDLPPEEAKVLDALAAFERLPPEPLPAALTATLRPYQKEGYDWLRFLYGNRFGACLADDMGLGKTVQTIALLAAVRQEGENRRPHLVVLPPTLLFNWRHEIETFCPSLSVEELTGGRRDIGSIAADVILTTYEIARRDIAVLEKREFNVIVFDEAQAIKNLSGERSKAMRRLKGRFKVCLTGTPLENHAGEYYSILELALPGLFGDYHYFMKSLGADAAFRPIDRARPFVLRRTKEKILSELPEKMESDIWLDLTETQKIFYTRAVAEVREEVFRAFEDKTAQQAGIVALSALTRLRQICISPALIDPAQTEVAPKVEYLLEKLRELEEEGHAALIFSQFTRTLDLVERELEQQNLGFCRIDGTTPQAQRKARVGAFQAGTGPAFFLISLKTGGVGLNLTRASYVFHLDPWWNPAVENQASDRAHRIGQKQRVLVNRLLMRHTVEEKMMLLKQRKRALFEQVLGGAENRAGGSLLTRDDMAWLLEG